MNQNLQSQSTKHTVHVYNHTFRIRWFNASPDGYTRPILGINDQIVSPIIVVEEGDTVNVTILNESGEPTTIHWHGVHQTNTLHMDGVPGVTQCSIQPNETFVHTYSTANQSGTYWYHSHYAMQYGDGLKGVLIIKDRNDPYKNFYTEEEILQITDWYHTPVHILLKPYLYPGTFDPIPDSALLNGIGQFRCTWNETCSYYRSRIRPGSTKRFRIINTSVYATITLTIDQHQMRLIEADGIYLDGIKYLRALRLNPGQRYSVLVTANRNYSSNYWIRATMHPFVDDRRQYNSSSQPYASAILQYGNNEAIPSITSFNMDELVINQSISDGEIFSDEPGLIPMNLPEYQLPKSENIRTLIFDSKHAGTDPGAMYFNNETFVHPTNLTFLSLVIHEHLSKLPWPSTLEIENDQIIDVVINNIDFAPHPFHLHGHHVWVLAQGRTDDGYFNQSTLANLILNDINPIFRDTFTVNPFSYVVFRFKTNNPGIWMLHCHNDWHLQIGMSLVFVESPQLIQDYYREKNLTSIVPFHCSHP